MTLQQVMSYSYDMLAITFSFVAVALFFKLYLMQTKDKEFIKTLVLYIIVSIFFLPLKSFAYVFFLFLLLYIVVAKFCGKYVPVIERIVIVLCVLLVVLGIGLLIYLHCHPNTIKSIPNYMEWANEDGYSVSYVLNHPKKSVQVLINTYVYRFQYYFIDTLIGTSLGYLDVLLNVFFQFAFCGLLFISSIKTENEKCIITKKMRVMFFAIFFITINAILFAFLISYTPFSYPYIMGVQGRYFIPVLLLGGLAVYGRGIKSTEHFQLCLPVVSVILNAMVIYNVLD
jgi:uncharacterized membrane protein